MTGNGWDQYQLLVLEKLAKLEENDKCIDKKVGDLRVDVAQLKVKAGLFGALAGFLGAATPIIIGLAIALLKGLL
jgi:hypothetical protein